MGVAAATVCREWPGARLGFVWRVSIPGVHQQGFGPQSSVSHGIITDLPLEIENLVHMNLWFDST